MIFKGKILNLREADTNDVKLIAKYMTDEEFCYLLFGTKSEDVPKLENEIALLIGKGGGIFGYDFYYVIETKQKEPIGLVIFRNIDWKNRNLTYELIITEKKYRGRKYGVDTILTSFMLAFKELNMHKVMGRIHSFNGRMLKFIEQGSPVFKMTKEGSLRGQAFRDGKYYDTIVFSMLESEYQKFRKTFFARMYYLGVKLAVWK